MKKFSKISENNTFINLEREDVCILFTDIKGSSNLWKLYNLEMFKALDILDKRMNMIIENHSGMVVKTIGDSFMVSFSNLYSGIKCAYNLLKDLENNPIVVGDEKIEIRIGMCYGGSFVKYNNIQNCLLKDYYGNTVGTASRLESKVADVDSFVFAYTDSIIDEIEDKDILEFLNIQNIDIEVIQFSNTCINMDENRVRSGRLLDDLQINICKDIEILKGVNEIKVFKCKI